MSRGCQALIMLSPLRAAFLTAACAPHRTASLASLAAAGVATNVVPKLKDPAFVLPAAALTSAAAYSVYNYHTTLQ